MRRARAMLVSELRAHDLGFCEIMCEDVQEGPEPPAWVLAAELQGLCDFEAGVYDPACRGINSGWGKHGARAPHVPHEL